MIAQPLTPDRWQDFETLFGVKGAYAGCWCMYWRISRKRFEAQQGEGNRRAMRALVDSGQVPGILAYEGDRAVGWCSVAPREDFASLNRSPVLKSIDDEPVWSIVCFFIARDWRGQGLSAALIQAAVDYVRQQGGRTIEAYPYVPRSDKVPPVSNFMGFPGLFDRLGFVEVARPSAAKRIYRYMING